MKPRKKYIQIMRSRHGRTMYYFRRGRGGRLRLPDDYGSPAFWEAYKLAAEQAIATPPKSLPKSFAREQKGRVGKSIASGIKAASARAAKSGRPCDISYEWAIETIEAQKFRCALTGIPFYSKRGTSDRINPFAPSLDRIDPKGGYTKNNVRIVVFALNVMLMDWGTEVFEAVANRYRAFKGTKGRMLPTPGAKAPPTPEKIAS